MEKGSFQKHAMVYGEAFPNELSEAYKLLRDAGYIVHALPVEGTLKIKVYPSQDRNDARNLSLPQLKRFLNGEEIPLSALTIL